MALICACSANSPAPGSPTPSGTSVPGAIASWIDSWNLAVDLADRDEIRFVRSSTFADLYAIASTPDGKSLLGESLIAAAHALESSTSRIPARSGDETAYSAAVRQQRRDAEAFGEALLAASKGHPTWPVPLVPAVPPRMVTGKAKDLLMPVSEFPLKGFTAAEDEDLDFVASRRYLGPPGSPYTPVIITITVLPFFPSGSSFAEKACTSSSQTAPVQSEVLTVAPTGESSRGCRFVFASGDRRLDYDVSDRNLLISVQLFVGGLANDALAADQAIVIARSQLSVVARLSPP